jgi:hypothetical protein
LTKIELMLSRSSACSVAMTTACCWTASKERASSPVSSFVKIGTGWTACFDASTGSGSARIRSTVAGSLRFATSSASTRSTRSGLSSERATMKVTSRAMSSAASTIAASRSAVRVAALAASSASPRSESSSAVSTVRMALTTTVPFAASSCELMSSGTL